MQANVIQLVWNSSCRQKFDRLGHCAGRAENIIIICLRVSNVCCGAVRLRCSSQSRALIFTRTTLHSTGPGPSRALIFTRTTLRSTGSFYCALITESSIGPRLFWGIKLLV